MSINDVDTFVKIKSMLWLSPLENDLSANPCARIKASC